MIRHVPLAERPRPNTPLLRVLYLGPLAWICGIVAILLVLGAKQTDSLFVWTVRSPMTAVTMAAGFLTAAILLGFAAYQDEWANARLAALVPIPLLGLFAYLNHRHADDLHPGGGDLVSNIFTPLWKLAFYGLPLLAIVALAWQFAFARGTKAPRRVPIPAWARTLVDLLGAAFLILGGAFFVSPKSWMPFFPWQVSELDLRALCAWAITFGIALLIAVWEDDLKRVTGGLLAFAAFGVAELVGLVVFRAELDWSRPPAWVFTLLAAATVGVGAIGLLLSVLLDGRAPKSAPVPAPQPVKKVVKKVVVKKVVKKAVAPGPTVKP